MSHEPAGSGRSYRVHRIEPYLPFFNRADYGFRDQKFNKAWLLNSQEKSGKPQQQECGGRNYKVRKVPAKSPGEISYGKFNDGKSVQRRFTVDYAVYTDYQAVQICQNVVTFVAAEFGGPQQRKIRYCGSIQTTQFPQFSPAEIVSFSGSHLFRNFVQLVPFSFAFLYKVVYIQFGFLGCLVFRPFSGRQFPNIISRRGSAVKKNVKTITIETPEHLELELQLAGIGARFIAFLIDRLIQIGAILGIMFFVTVLLFFAGQISQFVEFLGRADKRIGQWLIALGFIFYGLITIGYFVIFEYFWSGTTPGKRSQEIRVIRKDGRPLSIFDSAIRNILRFVDILADVYPIGFIVMFLDSKNRRLGDLVAGTIVISERGGNSPEIRQFSADESLLAPELKSAAARMTSDDYRVISKFLSRRKELDPDERSMLASKIAQRIMNGIDANEIKTDPEKFLEVMETLYKQRTRIL